MQITYCDKCGRRIPNNNAVSNLFTRSYGYQEADKYFLLCDTCLKEFVDSLERARNEMLMDKLIPEVTNERDD